MKAPLEGYRVLDWTIYHQGPIAAAHLADLGAEVIKIEPPEGDPGRKMLEKLGVDAPLNFYFHNNNRGKKSIVLDLEDNKGKEILYKLVEKSDVFITNHLYKDAKRLKVDYETLSKHNPKLIYTACSGYGLEGPEADKPGDDLLIQARAGIIRYASGVDGTPTAVGAGFSEAVGGVAAAYGTLVALFTRERTGIGQLVDTSMFGAALEMLREWVSFYASSGKPPSISVLGQTSSPLWYFYGCKDGKWVVLSVLQPDRFWHDFCAVVGIAHLADDPKFKDAAARRTNLAEILPIVKEKMLTKTRDEWLKLFAEKNIAAAPMNDMSTLQDDQQVKANEYFVEVNDPRYGKVKVPSSLVKPSKTPGKITRLAPELGEHTKEVLKSLGL